MILWISSQSINTLDVEVTTLRLNEKGADWLKNWIHVANSIQSTSLLLTRARNFCSTRARENEREWERVTGGGGRGGMIKDR